MGSNGGPKGIRTPVTAVKGRYSCISPSADVQQAQVGPSGAVLNIRPENYACANPRKHDGIQVVTMEGSRGMPLLEKITQFVSDTIEWHVLFDVVVLPVYYRTWTYNAGA